MRVVADGFWHIPATCVARSRARKRSGGRCHGLWTWDSVARRLLIATLMALRPSGLAWGRKYYPVLLTALSRRSLAAFASLSLAEAGG